ncbi:MULTISPECIES: phenylacetate--CoA ligase [Thermodesulfovibrio]|uniref:Phenylacetate-coenzyme A ligase n=1 Tax=Thermodesulfovibrio yellowstonii (strain ATCC 51303 / DSM 11347 / YP87) TaxID=289376 RepID=B5YK56_THEYD|nr:MULTISPECIES: phenylacetate--CoA ligase [Thermodesulfovibrio]ACI21833.1 PaaF [Thermodesulfovibrio yellowstonii DSM 11347]MDI6865338.1 phenylacetate--CoA ligase [Thermodesulfovibrio yellowstonii]
MQFWNKELETVPRQKLEQLQLERLKKVLKRVYQKVPHYRKKFQEAGANPLNIKSLDDIKFFPFTTKEDLFVDYPYGLLTVSPEKVIRLHTSSGTTGKPKAIFFSKKDINNSAELIARCLVMTGATKGDILQNSMTYGLFTGAFVMHYGAEKVGILVIPAGPGNTERQINLMKDFGTTMLHITPSYALYVASVLYDKGIDPRKDLKLKRAYLGAEPYSEETRKKIENMLGIDIYNCYGLTEMNGPGVGFECIYKDGLHIWEDNFLMEIINPETGQSVADGEIGELVLTTLNREAMPLIRYRTRDLTRIILEPCRCGRTHRRISRILGRSDDMFIVKGVNIFPQQIEQVLMGIKGVAQNYQIILEAYDEMVIKVEIDRELFDGKIEKLIRLKDEIVDKIRSATMVKPKVELLEPGTLPVSEGKAKRVIDKRTI